MVFFIKSNKTSPSASAPCREKSKDQSKNVIRTVNVNKSSENNIIDFSARREDGKITAPIFPELHNQYLANKSQRSNFRSKVIKVTTISLNFGEGTQIENDNIDIINFAVRREVIPHKKSLIPDLC